MPELRKDPIVGRWVIIATERAMRPGNFIDFNGEGKEEKKEDCPFCEHRESMVPPEIHAVRDHQHPANGPGWKIRVIPSRKPFLKNEPYFQRRGHGLYDVVNGVGAHEVIVETPEHKNNMADLDVSQIQLVLQTYVLRFNELEKNPQLKFIMAYKNYERSIGNGRVGHSRSQIVASPVNPMRAKDKLNGAKQYYDYHERCIYCDLLAQEQTYNERVVLESSHFMAITPFASRFPFELWIIPKKHSCDFAKGVAGLEGDLAQVLKNILVKIKKGLNNPDYNFVVHTAPFRREQSKNRDWKTIEQDYHWHIEVMPRLTRVAGFEKGSGFYICSIPPENTAEFLRGVKTDV